MSEPVLRLVGVKREYASGETTLHVLKGVDLEVRPGEIVGLIGPSGSGKSSLLHAAGLLEHPTEGKVFVEGRECGALGDKARTRIRLATIGFVYQFHHLLPELSALDNVALPVMIAGGRRKAALERARDLLQRLGLAERTHHQPGQLSGGEQQRVAVARALANQPRLLLADEPTGNLDPETSSGVFQALYDLARATGVGALIATHNLELTRHMDRVLVMRDGHVVEQSPEGAR
ncbi:MAG TPA: ABC transporter ATP-binding protein [Caulobacteraceae bacterium]|nr:ABC transporter ATP-binding protein [Caulobacteraceae bacterium]